MKHLGFNLTWFAILVAVNLQTAWLSPPVALSAYFLKGVVPEWDLKRYLLWNDAIYGNSSNWINFNYCIPTDCFMASSLSVWTVGFISLLSS